MMLMYAVLSVIIMLILPPVIASAASSFSSMVSALDRQAAIENENEATETIIGLSSTDGDYLILGVSQTHKLKVRNGGPILVSVGHEGLVMGFVGLPVDKIVALRIAQNFILEYFSNMNENIPVGILAMHLADDLQERSKSASSAPLVYNALILGRSFSDVHSKSNVKLIKVDQSNGFFDCKAVAIGCNAQHVNAWLGRKYKEAVPESIDALIDVGFACLKELNLETEINFELCVVKAHPYTRIHGPFALSHSLRDKLNSNQFKSLLKNSIIHT